MKKIAGLLLEKTDVASLLVLFAVIIFVVRNVEVVWGVVMAFSTPGFSEGEKAILSSLMMVLSSLAFPLVLIGLAKVIRLLEEKKNNA